MQPCYKELIENYRIKYDNNDGFYDFCRFFGCPDA